MSSFKISKKCLILLKLLISNPMNLIRLGAETPLGPTTYFGSIPASTNVTTGSSYVVTVGIGTTSFSCQVASVAAPTSVSYLTCAINLVCF